MTKETDWGKLQVEASNVIAKMLSDRAEKLLLWTAQDVRKSAQSSIKSGGKSQKSKNYAASKPGDPPKSHKGTLKQGIVYERDGGRYLIGPRKAGNSRALKTLEFGGDGEFKETAYSEEYVRSRRRRRNQSTRSKGAASKTRRAYRPPRVHPKAARPYRVYGRGAKSGVLIRDYLYFYSSDAWERARNAFSFQSWAASQRLTTVTRARVEPRPYMRPSLIRETSEQKNRSRMTRVNRALSSGP